jgi:hypothetical protein
MGAVVLQFLIPINESELSPLEKNCQQIANDGYRMHTMYPDSHPDDLPEYDRKRLVYLDELWMKECVSVLPADSIFNIANNVERDFSHGE